MNGKPWTPEEIDYLVRNYPDQVTECIAEYLNRTKHSVYHRAFALGLHKSEAFHLSEKSGRLQKLTNSGVQFRFPKGHVPVNKGMKMSPEIKEKVKHTFFEKGHTPANTKHDGAISLREDKNGNSYFHIRIKKGKWNLLHQHLWIQNHGPIPKGMIVVFKDKNSKNCVIENLELITLSENMRRNQIHHYPAELREVIKLKNKVKRIINTHEQSNKSLKRSSV